MNNPYIEKEDDYGDVITRESYEENVASTGFIDEDGFCRAGKEIDGVDMYTKKTYRPSQIKQMPKDYEFVQWYNG